MASEINSARQTLGSAELQMTINFEPSGWFQPSATGYWTTFNSSQTSSSTSSTSTATTAAPVASPVASRPYWQLRSYGRPVNELSPALHRFPYRPQMMVAAAAAISPVMSSVALVDAYFGRRST
jgi:hypothetical protein